LLEAKRLIARTLILIATVSAVALAVAAIPIDPEIRIHKGAATTADRELGYVLLDGRRWLWTAVYVAEDRRETEIAQRCPRSSNPAPEPAPSPLNRQCQTVETRTPSPIDPGPPLARSAGRYSDVKPGDTAQPRPADVPSQKSRQPKERPPKKASPAPHFPTCLSLQRRWFF